MMKKIIIILICLIFTLSPLVSAVTLESGIIIEPTDSNTTYILGDSLSFSNVAISNATPYFNDSIFQIEADSGTASVVINSLTSFVVTATDAVVFTLGGFSANENYDIEVDDIVWSVVTTDATGVLSFNYSSWSTHTFSIVLHIRVINDGGGNGRERAEPEPSEISLPERPDYALLWLALATAIIILIIILVMVVKREKLY